MSQEEKSKAEEIFYCPHCNEKIIVGQAHPLIFPHCGRDPNLDPSLYLLDLVRASGLFADDL